jgi:hypothetical protein
MTEHTPSATRTVECQCAMGDECSVFAPGHKLPLIQHRVAAATASKWRDAIVEDIAADGWIQLITLDDNSRVSAWHHADLTQAISVGHPVAIHSLYHVLAVGRSWLNVDVTAPVSSLS